MARDRGGHDVRTGHEETVRQLACNQIRTSFARLRPARPPAAVQQLADAPIRVVPTDDGHFEVLDGFGRFERWCAVGRTTVPAIVERPLSAIDHKRFMLVANAPPRTVTAADEARVVQSLIDEDGLTARAVSNLLSKKPRWVAQRLHLATRLSTRASAELAAGRLGPTAAHALAALATKDQDQVLESALAHRLRATDIAILVAAYRVADECDRPAMLADPRCILAPDPSPILTPRAAELEGRLDHFHRLLADIRTFTLPADLAGPERRRLEALQRSLYQDLVGTVRALDAAWPGAMEAAPDVSDHPQSDTDHDRTQGGSHVDDQPPATAITAAATEGEPAPAEEKTRLRRDQEGDPAPARVLRLTSDRRARQRVAQGGAARAPRGGTRDEAQGRSGPLDRAVPRADQGASARRVDDHAHPSRDPGAGVSRAAHDPGCTRPRAPHPASDPGSEEEREEAVRDRSGT